MCVDGCAEGRLGVRNRSCPREFAGPILAAFRSLHLFRIVLQGKDLTLGRSLKSQKQMSPGRFLKTDPLSILNQLLTIVLCYSDRSTGLSVPKALHSSYLVSSLLEEMPPPGNSTTSSILNWKLPLQGIFSVAPTSSSPYSYWTRSLSLTPNTSFS